MQSRKLLAGSDAKLYDVGNEFIWTLDDKMYKDKQNKRSGETG